MQRGRLKTDMHERAQWWKAEIREKPIKGTSRVRVQHEMFMAEIKHCTAHRTGQFTTKYFDRVRQVGVAEEQPNGEIRFYLIKEVQ